jgi:hypothetical protein
MSRTIHPKETTTTSSAPAAIEVESLLASVAAVAGPAPALTSKDRKRSVKLRKGGEKVVPTILALSDRLGLSLPSHPTAAIQADLDKVKTLAPVHVGIVSAEKHLGDAIFQAQSRIWEGATVHYTVLKRLAKTDGDIANALAPVTQFFAQKSPGIVKAEDAKRGHRKGVKEPKGSEATTATTEGLSVAQAPVAPTAPAAAVTPAVPTQISAPVGNGAPHS